MSRAVGWAAAWALALGVVPDVAWSNPLQLQDKRVFDVPHPDAADRPPVAQVALRPGEQVGVALAHRRPPAQRSGAVNKLVALFDASGRSDTSQLAIQAADGIDQDPSVFVAKLAAGVDALVIDRSGHWHFGGQLRQRLGDGAAEAPPLQAFRAPIMSTAIDLLLPAGPQAPAQAEQVFAIFREVEGEMNEWRADSPTARINQAAGVAAVAASDDLRQLLRIGLEVSRRTGGAFDPTWAALWGLWDFSAAAAGRVPTPAELAPRLALIDYRRVRVDDAAGTVQLAQAGMKLGLGGIAKGWALARAGQWLRGQGVQRFSLSAGGQVLVAGRAGARPWRVGVRDPRGPASAVVAVLHLTDVSVSTSGDYEHFFERDGVRYHHILDTRSGMPARGLRSATVVSADATLADALSTALMVLGRKQALALVARWPGVECLLVDDRGKVWMSAGLRGRTELRAP